MANNINIANLIQYTAVGVRVATFAEIRNAVIERYKSVYGSDIDLSTATADGVFVNDLSLIISNILQGVQNIYANLDVNTATGVYLDALCALSNVTRRPATASNVSVKVTNTGTETVKLDYLLCVDGAGVEWKYNGAVEIAASETKAYTLTCTIIGAVEAPAGWITQTVELLPLTIEQTEAANVGAEIESDAELRARRAQSSGAAGTTVLESLVGALRGIAGIDDVYIYNNNTDAAMTSNDGTTIDPHSVYIIVRQEAGLTIDAEQIGTIIHEKLTPGIHSCASSGTNGIAKSYDYYVRVFDKSIMDSVQTVYWKQATPIAPRIEITITPYNYFDVSEFAAIAQGVIAYLNALSIRTAIDKNQLLVETMQADPRYKGAPTYTVSYIDVTDSAWYGKNPDTYYNYTNYAYLKNDDGTYFLILN